MLKKISLFLMLSVILFIPAQNAPAFSIRYHYDLIREVMQKEGFSEDSINIAIAANCYTDILQEADPLELLMDNDDVSTLKKIVDYLHFDQLYSREVIDKYFRRLVYNTYNVLNYYTSYPPDEKLNGSYPPDMALSVIGTSLHILQDFYSHSNWADLDISGYANIKDATYFDVVMNNPNAMDLAIIQNTEMTPDLKEKGLYTNGNSDVPTPNHDVSNKDKAGRKNFVWAYRAAYKASLEWIKLCEKWLTDDLGRSNYLDYLKVYEYWDDRDELSELTSYDEGTFRYLFTYAGSWTHSERWGVTAMVLDDLPNVDGIGLLGGNLGSSSPPIAWAWYQACANVANGLFEAQSIGNFEIMWIENGEPAQSVVSESALNIPANGIIDDAYAYLASILDGDKYPVEWLAVTIPHVRDSDPGDGWFNINNEEGGDGSQSDYWPAITINNTLFTEAPLMEVVQVDTLWGAWVPLWNNNPVPINIVLYELDPRNHKDEEMDINPNSGEDYIDYVINPDILKSIPGGETFVSGGDNYDWAAELTVKSEILADMPFDPATVPNIGVLYKCSDPTAPYDPHMKPHFKLVNNGSADILLSELTIRYWYTSEGSQEQQIYIDYAALGNGNIITSITSLEKQRENADSYLEIGFATAFTTAPEWLSPGTDTGEIQTRLNKINYKNYNETADYSYNPLFTNYNYNSRITVYRNGKLINGVEPRLLDPAEYPMGRAKVWTKDEMYGSSNNITLRLYVENVGNGVLDNFDVYYYFTTENGKTPEMVRLDHYWTPDVTITLEHLIGEDYRIRFRFVDSNIAPGDVSPTRDGFSIGIHYTDYSDMDDTNDRSYPGSPTFVANTDIQVIDYGAIPDPPVAKARRLLTVISLKCDQTEDSGEDEISLYIDTDGENADEWSHDMNEPDTELINRSYPFMGSARFRLVDRDGDFPGDDDDNLGNANVNLAVGSFTVRLRQDGADYTIAYQVSEYIPDPVALKKITVKQIHCLDTLYANSTDTITFFVTGGVTPTFTNISDYTNNSSRTLFSEHYFYDSEDSFPILFFLSSGATTITMIVAESSDGAYSAYVNEYGGSYRIDYTVETVEYRVPELPPMPPRYILTLKYLQCIVTEDSAGGDECHLKIFIDDVHAETRYYEINNGEIKDINVSYIFFEKMRFNLMEEDGDWDFGLGEWNLGLFTLDMDDDDDDLGSFEVTIGANESFGYFENDGANYRLYYSVEKFAD